MIHASRLKPCPKELHKIPILADTGRVLDATPLTSITLETNVQAGTTRVHHESATRAARHRGS